MTVQFEARSYDHPDVVALVAAIQAMYQRMYGGNDDDPTDPSHFTPPDGLFLVGYEDGTPLACGGWRKQDAHTAEIKRMYVTDAARGRGLGGATLEALERSAAEAGVRRIVLNTGSRQPDAMRFYERAGYVRTDARYGYYERFEGAHFFTKDLPSLAS